MFFVFGQDKYIVNTNIYVFTYMQQLQSKNHHTVKVVCTW